MKIAIVSDSHDNLATLDKFLAYIKQNPVAAVIHCGDIAEGATLERLVLGFGGPPPKGARLARMGGPILAALGNMDYRETVETIAKKYPKQIQLFKTFGQAELDGLKIGFCHFPETGKIHCQTGDFDFVFYGHTHKPWIEAIGKCQLANPGTLAGMFYQATFAILDAQTKKLDLKILNRL